MTIKASVALAVLISSVADAAITWSSPSLDANGAGVVSLQENKNGSLGINFTATDGGTVTYKIKSQTPSGVFTLNNATGVLSLAAGHQLNYEVCKRHMVIVTASGSSSTGTANVTINILDVNEFAPLFTSTLYSANVPDGAIKGTSVLTVTAKDGDGNPPNQNVKAYQLVVANNSDSAFVIDANGAITTAKQLFAKSSANYALVVTATDSGSPAKIGTATVRVCVGCSSGGSAVWASGLLALLSAWVVPLFRQ